MTVDQLFGAFPRVVVVSAVEIYSFDMMAVTVNKIRSIVRHTGTFLLGGSIQHSLSPISTDGAGDDGNSLLGLYVQNAAQYSGEPADRHDDLP